MKRDVSKGGSFKLKGGGWYKDGYENQMKDLNKAVIHDNFDWINQ